MAGIPIRSNLSDEDTENYAALVSQLAIKAHHVVRWVKFEFYYWRTSSFRVIYDF